MGFRLIFLLGQLRPDGSISGLGSRQDNAPESWRGISAHACVASMPMDASHWLTDAGESSSMAQEAGVQFSLAHEEASVWDRQHSNSMPCIVRV